MRSENTSEKHIPDKKREGGDKMNLCPRLAAWWLSGFSAHSLPERQMGSIPAHSTKGSDRQRVVFLVIEFQSSVWFGFHIKL